MEQLRASWQRSRGNKIALIAGGLIGFLILCCVIIAILPSPQRPPTAISPTAQQAAQAATGVTRPTEAPQPTDIPKPSATPAPTNTPEATATPAPTEVPRGYVSHALLGDAWPLTVEDGTIICNGAAFLLRTNQGLYAVNGTARGMQQWKDIREITKPDPKIEGLIMNVQPIIDRALDIC